MKFLLDTNICIFFFRKKFNLLEKFEDVGIENCSISEITLAELTYGAECSTNPSKNLRLIANFVEQTAILPVYDAIPEYGQQKARLRKAGTLISDFDLLIGATAIAHNLIMVTDNEKEFKRLDRITLENWVTR